jgi:hypothetical protein
MISFIEPLYKSQTSILFGWNPEPGATAYNIYVGLNALTSSMAHVATNINPTPGASPTVPGKVSCKVNIADVWTVLGITSGDFSTSTYYFALTYNSPSESPVASSKIVQVPPMGVMSKYMRDDPTTNRHPYVFSDDIQSWVKAAGSPFGAAIVDTADFYKSNITIEYKYDSTNLSTVKSYLSDATSPGLPAKLTTYSYGAGGFVSKIQITDSTI